MSNLYRISKDAATLRELVKIRSQRELEIAKRFSALKKEGFKAGDAAYFSQRCGEFVSEDGKSLYMFSHLDKRKCSQIGQPVSPQVYKVTMERYGYTKIEMPSFQKGLASISFRYDPRPEAYNQLIVSNLPDNMPSKVYEEGFERPTIEFSQQADLLHQLGLIPQLYSSSTQSECYHFGPYGENSAVCPDTWKLDIKSMVGAMINNKPLEGYICQKAQEFDLVPPMNNISQKLGLPELVQNYSIDEAFDILTARMSNETNLSSLTESTEDCQG